MTNYTHPDLIAWARGQLSDAELEQRTGLSPQQAQYTDEARAVWFAEPMPPDSMCPHCGNGIISEDDAGPDWWHCDTCGYAAHEDEFYPAGARLEPVERLSYEGMTGFTVEDLEAWAAEQLRESEGGEG